MEISGESSATVHQNEIGTYPLGLPNGIGAIDSFAHDFDLSVGLEQRLQPAAHGRLVVRYDHSDGASRSHLR
jgi:hypothetical protein